MTEIAKLSNEAVDAREQAVFSSYYQQHFDSTALDISTLPFQAEPGVSHE